MATTKKAAQNPAHQGPELASMDVQARFRDIQNPLVLPDDFTSCETMRVAGMGDTGREHHHNFQGKTADSTDRRREKRRGSGRFLRRCRCCRHDASAVAGREDRSGAATAGRTERGQTVRIERKGTAKARNATRTAHRSAWASNAPECGRTQQRGIVATDGQGRHPRYPPPVLRYSRRDARCRPRREQSP